MSIVLSRTASPFCCLEDHERRFLLPPSMQDRLEQVRVFLEGELEESPLGANSLLHAALVLSAAEPGRSSLDRLIPLAAGAQMVHDALISQQASVQPDAPPDFFGILSHDLILARALDLFTRDGHSQATEAISSGSIRLCEALLADRTGESAALTTRLLSEFYAACVRIGTGVAQVSSDIEQARARQVENAVHAIAEGDKESITALSKEAVLADSLFDQVIQRWLSGR